MKKQVWGNLPDGREVFLYTLRNKNGMEAQISTYGGILVSLLVPDKTGNLQDVVLGYDTLQEYLTWDEYFGATVGRYANRIAGGKFTLNGKEYQVTQNDGDNCLHGGGEMSHDLWLAKEDGEVLELTFVSPDGSHGYPGTMTATVRLWLDEENSLHLDYTAKSDKETIVNLTNHAYFNFSGEKTMLDHELWVNAEQYTAVDETLIPTADVHVSGTEFDFRTPKKVGRPIYDHNFLLRGGDGLQATVYDAKTGIFMEMFTDMPGVQFYTAGGMATHKGKGGCTYGSGAGLCLETQIPPNAPNRPECQKYNYIVKPGETWTSSTVYRFSVR